MTGAVSIQQNLTLPLSIAALLACFVPSIARATTLPDPAVFQSASTLTVLVAPHSVPKASVQREAVRLFDVDELILSTFPDAPVMLAIARCESGDNCRGPINPNAQNPHSTARGVFQILAGSWSAYGCTGSRTDAADNIRCARRMYDASGLAPWAASRDKWGT